MRETSEISCDGANSINEIRPALLTIVGANVLHNISVHIQRKQMSANFKRTGRAINAETDVLTVPMFYQKFSIEQGCVEDAAKKEAKSHT